MTNLRLSHRQSGWWIVGCDASHLLAVPDEDSDARPGEIGPYHTRREADEDRVGLQRFLDQHDKPKGLFDYAAR